MHLIVLHRDMRGNFDQQLGLIPDQLRVVILIALGAYCECSKSK